MTIKRARPCGPSARCPECRDYEGGVFCACRRCAADGSAAVARVSVATLAADTSCSERTVRRDIRALVGMGVVSRLGPDEFVIHCDVLEGMQRVGDA